MDWKVEKSWVEYDEENNVYYIQVFRYTRKPSIGVQVVMNDVYCAREEITLDELNSLKTFACIKHDYIDYIIKACKASVKRTYKANQGGW